jgi:Holliday junction resolvase-like predicted endonuclease
MATRGPELPCETERESREREQRESREREQREWERGAGEADIAMAEEGWWLCARVRARESERVSEGEGEDD